MKKIVLKPIGADNILSAFALKLADAQKIYVSHPMRSLALGYAYRDFCRPFGICDGEKMVGYVMIRFDPDRHAYILWHFMIDAAHQGKGYGRAALNAALDDIRSKPMGDAECVLLTCHPENTAALGLYQSVGFAKTGRTEGVEIELKLDI